MVGNDVVDIDFCEKPKHHHVRYLERVCTPEEAERVRQSIDPVGALALTWASKEAAYKLFSKQSARCHFVPRQFVTQIENCDPVQIDQKLLIRYAGMQTEVSIFAEQSWVHAVAADPGMKIHWTVREIDKCFLGSRKAVGESEAVRFLSNALLEELGLDDASLQFDGRVPKLVCRGGGFSGMDISLAHHGAFAAAAIAWPAGRRASQYGDDAGSATAKSLEAVCSTCTA